MGMRGSKIVVLVLIVGTIGIWPLAADAPAMPGSSTPSSSPAYLPKPHDPAIDVDAAQPVVSTAVTATRVAGGEFQLPNQSGAGSAVGSEHPDLDLGYFNYVEVCIKVPQLFTGDIQLNYRCTGPGSNGAPESDGTVTIPNSMIPSDGAVHSYRIDMGLQPYWRGRLTGLSLKATAGALDLTDATINIGDLPGDTYAANRELPNKEDPKVGATHELESKHFRMVWSVERERLGFTEKDAEGCLRNAEEVWQVYMKILHMREPCRSMKPENETSQKLKINLLNIYNGYWMSGSPSGYGYLNIETSGLRVDPPTWVIPHELMHVFEMHQGGKMSGQWWESYANYGRERWLYYYSPFLFPDPQVPDETVSNLEKGFARMAHWFIPHPRDYYLCWPIFLYLDENPDHLPLLGGGDFTPKLWQQAQAGDTIFDTVQRLTNGATSTKDIIGLYARRNVTWDYSHQAALRKNADIDSKSLSRDDLTELDQTGEDPTWWRVPLDRAPQQGGYAVHELAPTPGDKSRTISVNFRGLPDKARGADWRTSLVVVDDSGHTRYSSMWRNGTNSVTLAADENKVYLVVAATPDPYLPGEFDDEAFPYQSHPQRQRFPYEVQITGAVPRELHNSSTAGLIQHPNGGGWKSPTSTVDPTAYVGPNARVLDTAKVESNARLEDFAVVKDNASVRDHAVISGHGVVEAASIVKDFAKVRDWGMVSADAVVGYQARVIQHGSVSGKGSVSDFATVEGYAGVTRDSPADRVGGDAVLSGDYASGRTVLNGFQFGFLPYQGTLQKWIDERKAPAHLFLDYEFDQTNDSLAKDFYGTSDGILKGAPEWNAGDGGRKGFLVFNGASQFVSLPGEAGDFHECTIMAWARPDGGAPNQPIFFFGAAADRFFYATLNNGNNPPQLVVRYKGTDLTVTSDSPLVLQGWIHIAIALNGQTATLFINGKTAGSAPCSLTADQFLAPNVTTGRQQNYLARGMGDQLPFFKGALDGFRVYSKAFTEDELQQILNSSAAATAKPSPTSQ